MKVQKLIPLTIEYESSIICDNWIAFKILRTLENTYLLEGVTDTNTWNQFLKDPFSTIPSQKIIKNDLVFISPEILAEYPNFDDIILSEEKTYSIFKNESTFQYDLFKKYPHYKLFKKNSIAIKNSFRELEYYYLSDLDNNVSYYETFIQLPSIPEIEKNKNIFLTLLNLLENETIEILPLYNAIHETKANYIEAFKNILHKIENPYVSNNDDFCAPEPEFMNGIGMLKFNIPDFFEFNDFFKITKKYVELDIFDVCEKNFPLILNLSIFKTFYDNLISEEFFSIFPEEYKIAQSVSLEYKLKPKNIQTKKIKI